MKSVWIIKHHGAPPGISGGIRQYNFAKSLAAKGYNVSYFISSFHNNTHEDMRLKKGESFAVDKVDGFNLVWIRTFPHEKNDWRRAVNFIDFGRRVYMLGRSITGKNLGVEKPDVIMAAYIPIVAPWFVYHLSRYYRARFILEVGDLWPQSFIDKGLIRENSLIAKILQYIERYLYSRAEEIITPLPFAAEYIAEAGFPDKGVYIGSGVDLSMYENIPEVAGRDAKHFTVMYLGAHGSGNVLMPCVHACKSIKDRGYHDIQLVLVGEGIEKPYLIKEAERLKLDNIKFEDPVPNNKVPETTACADAFIFHAAGDREYRYGINPNKLVDYMSAGKPIVFAANSRNNVVAETGCGVISKAGDPEKIADSIIELYKMSPEERDSMGAKGREYALKNLDINKVTDKLINILKV